MALDLSKRTFGVVVRKANGSTVTIEIASKSSRKDLLDEAHKKSGNSLLMSIMLLSDFDKKVDAKLIREGYGTIIFYIVYDEKNRARREAWTDLAKKLGL